MTAAPPPPPPPPPLASPPPYFLYKAVAPDCNVVFFRLLFSFHCFFPVFRPGRTCKSLIRPGGAKAVLIA